MSYIALLALLAAVPAPALAAAGGCTASSLMLPSWFVTSFQSSGVPESASFQLLNRATNTTSQLSCSGGVCSTTKGESKAEVTVQLTGSIATILVNETWTCSDATPDKPIVFSAVGSNSLALTCQTREGAMSPCTSTSTAPLLIKASLSSPAQFTPGYVSGPLGHATPGCAASSRSPSWELITTQYNKRTRYTAAGGPVQTVTQSLLVQFSNTVTGYYTSCTGFFNTDPTLQSMDCTGQLLAGPRERYHIESKALYDPVTTTVHINETWFCSDADPATPVAIHATAQVKLPMNDCFTDLSQVGSQPEEVVFCTNEDQLFTGKLVSQDALPPYSLTDPSPTGSSCTVTSFVAPAWRLSDFEVVAGDRGVYGSVMFSLDIDTTGTPANYPTPVFHSPVQLDLPAGEEPAWYPCDFAPGELSTVPSKCRFRYDHKARTLDLDAEWACRDLDSTHPVVFAGVTSTTVPELELETGAQSTRYFIPAGKSWTAKINSVTWRSAT